MTSIAPHSRAPLLRQIQSLMSPAWALALWVGSLGMPAMAADVGLKQLFEAALVKHPSVLQARSQAQAAGFDVEAAQWGRYPTLSSEVRSDTGYAQSLAKVEQPVWTGGKLTSRIELAESNQRTAQAGIQEAQYNALSQVASAFFEALRLEQRHQNAAAVGVVVDVGEPYRQPHSYLAPRPYRRWRCDCDLGLGQCRFAVVHLAQARAYRGRCAAQAKGVAHCSGCSIDGCRAVFR